MLLPMRQGTYVRILSRCHVSAHATPAEVIRRQSVHRYSCRKLHIFSVGLLAHFAATRPVFSQQSMCRQPQTFGSTGSFEPSEFSADLFDRRIGTRHGPDLKDGNRNGHPLRQLPFRLIKQSPVDRLARQVRNEEDATVRLTQMP